MTMKNFGLVLLAGGAAIVGLGFFMRKDGDSDGDDANLAPIDSTKQIAKPILQNPGELNLAGALQIISVTPTYS